MSNAARLLSNLALNHYFPSLCSHYSLALFISIIYFGAVSYFVWQFALEATDSSILPFPSAQNSHYKYQILLLPSISFSYMSKQNSVVSLPLGVTSRLLAIIVLVAVGRAQFCKTYQNDVCVECVSGYMLWSNECVPSSENAGASKQSTVADGLQPVKQLLLDYQPALVEVKPAVQPAQITTNLVQVKPSASTQQSKKLNLSGLNALIGLNLPLLKTNPNSSSSPQPKDTTKTANTVNFNATVDVGNSNTSTIKKISINELSFKPIIQLTVLPSANKIGGASQTEQKSSDAVSNTSNEVRIVPGGALQIAVKIDQTSSKRQNNTTLTQNTSTNQQSSSSTPQTDQKLVQASQKLVTVNQKPTEANQAIPLATPTNTTQNVSVQPAINLREIPKKVTDKESGLIKIGQQPTQVDQNLAQVKQVAPTSLPNNSRVVNLPEVPLVIPPSQGKGKDLLLTFQDILNKLGISNIPILNQQELNLVKIKKVNPIDVVSWPFSLNIDILPLILIQQVLYKFPLNQAQNTSSYNILKCTSSVSLFLLPNAQAQGIYQTERKYLTALSYQTTSFLKDYSLADPATICVDPIFALSYNLLVKNNKAVIGNLPILAAYYQYSGFAKNYRIYFIDDSKFPLITVHQGTVVVDLYRMMPFQVTFSVIKTKDISKI